MKSDKQDKITDELIGTDDKICRCSSVIADLISSSESRHSAKLKNFALSHKGSQKEQTAHSDKVNKA